MKLNFMGKTGRRYNSVFPPDSVCSLVFVSRSKHKTETATPLYEGRNETRDRERYSSRNQYIKTPSSRIYSKKKLNDYDHKTTKYYNKCLYLKVLIM